MSDFSAIDTATPIAGAALASALIRTFELAVKDGIQVEHALDGKHKIPAGTTGARPAAAVAGRVYLNTDEVVVQRDSGAAWVNFGAKAKIIITGTQLVNNGATVDKLIRSGTSAHKHYSISVKPTVLAGAAGVFYESAGAAAGVLAYVFRDDNTATLDDYLRLTNNSAAPINLDYEVVEL